MQALARQPLACAARRGGPAGDCKKPCSRLSRRAAPPPRCIAQVPTPSKATLPLLPPSRTILAVTAPLPLSVVTDVATPCIASHAPPPPHAAPPTQPATPPQPAAPWHRLPPLSPRVRGLLLLNLLTLLFGSNVSAVKAAQSALDPWSFGAGRFALAALAFAPALPRAARSPRLRAASAELGLLAAAGYAAQAWGLTATSASHTAFISAFTCLLVPVFAASGAFGPRGAVSQRTWAAAAVAVAGVAVLELGAGASGEVAQGVAATSLGGDAASLLAAALFAAQLVRTEYHAARLGADEAATDASAPASDSDCASASVSQGEASPAMALVAGQLATLAACFAAAAAASAALSGEAASAAPFSLEAVQALPWAAWLFTGLVSTAGTLWLELEALRDVSAPDAALVYATEPVWAAAVAALALGERWAGPTWAGAALIVGGSLYGQLPAADAAPEAAHAAAEEPRSDEEQR